MKLSGTILIFISVFWLSCTRDMESQLTNLEIERVDSIVIKHQQQWSVVHDSICETRMDSLIAFYYDSLLRQEIETIKKLDR